MKKLLQNNSVMLLLALCSIPAVNAQWQNGLWTGKQANNWYLYNNTGLNFETTPPTVLTDGQLFSPDDMYVYGRETHATISDLNGNLLFYTDGVTIWNRSHSIMENGTGLNVDVSSTQGTFIIPKPGHPNIYYVIIHDFTNQHILYSEVDMTLDSGLGAVTTKNNVLAYIYNPDAPVESGFAINDGTPFNLEKTAVTFHADGESMWLAISTWTKLYTFLITESGINLEPVVSDYTFDNIWNPAGQLKFSPDGSKIAFANYGGPEGDPDINRSLEIFNFDNLTGKITTTIASIENSLVAQNDFFGNYGLEFSPNGNYLYTTGPQVSRVFQFDLTLGNEEDIINSAKVVYEGSSNLWILKQLQLGNDGKIYMTDDAETALNVINYPNNPGGSIGFVENAQDIAGNQGNIGLPNFIANYFESGILYEGECTNAAITFSTIRIPGIETIIWNFGDTASGENNTSADLTPSHTYTTPGTYRVIATIISNGAEQTTETDVIITAPGAVVPQVTAVCADVNGNAVFNLSQLNAGILNGQDATQFNLNYYTSEANLQANSPIATPANFNTTGQVVYAQIINNTTGCKTTIQFNLPVNPLPRAAAPTSLTKCGTPARTASFNLTIQDTAILNGQDAANFVVKYYSDADAQNGIVTPENFTSAGQVVYAVVSNTATGCTSNIISFNLEVTEASFFTQALQFTGCPPFNLNAIATGLEEGLTLTYYASQQEAENNSNAIANPELYDTSAKEALLYVRAQNTDGCIDITQLVLQQDDCSIPKGISPNGDNKNDRFELSGFNVAHLGIYNRFGQEVYSQSNYTNQWHGQTNNNSELPTGTYYFMVQRVDGRSETGWVYINREE